MPRIRYTSYSINDGWKRAVKENKNLSHEQKKKLIKEARKTVFLDNLSEFGMFVFKVVLYGLLLMGLGLLIMWIASAFQGEL